MKKIDVDSDEFFIATDAEIADVLLEYYPMVFHKIAIALEEHYEGIRNTIVNK